MATKKQLKTPVTTGSLAADKLEANLQALREEDDFGGGLPVVGNYPSFENRDLSWFEMDLRDWGFVYGLAFGLLLRDNPELSHEDAAKRAFTPAHHVFVQWSGAIDNPAEKREQAIRTLVGLFEVGERDAYKALIQANSGNGHLEMTEKLREAIHDLAQSARG